MKYEPLWPEVKKKFVPRANKPLTICKLAEPAFSGPMFAPPSDLAREESRWTRHASVGTGPKSSCSFRKRPRSVENRPAAGSITSSHNRQLGALFGQFRSVRLHCAPSRHTLPPLQPLAAQLARKLIHEAATIYDFACARPSPGFAEEAHPARDLLRGRRRCADVAGPPHDCGVAGTGELKCGWDSKGGPIGTSGGGPIGARRHRLG